MKVEYKSKTVEININSNIIEALDNRKRYFIITDENVYNIYQDYFSYLKNKDYFIIKPGEASKSLRVVEEAITELLSKDYNRNDTIIAFGGGVVGDIAGFIASIYKRGVNYIIVPTTLISQVDSAIGGKVGINYLGYKNQIGSFYHPNEILINPNFLKSLPKAEFTSGMCEVVKYAVLFDQQMFNDILTNNYDLNTIIKKCVEYKIKITLKDELDLKERQILNFGHTIGHAIEAKYKLSHGISIGYGMYFESKIESIKEVLVKLGLDFNNKFNGLSQYILKDKKRNNNKIMIVRVKDIGNAYLEEGDINEYFSK